MPGSQSAVLRNEYLMYSQYQFRQHPYGLFHLVSAWSAFRYFFITFSAASIWLSKSCW